MLKFEKGVFMYYFPNLENKTRSIMISELERDIKNGLFYEPRSMKSEYISSYKLLLKKYFEIGQVESLEKALTPSFFKAKDKKVEKYHQISLKQLLFLILTVIMKELFWLGRLKKIKVFLFIELSKL